MDSLSAAMLAASAAAERLGTIGGNAVISPAVATFANGATTVPSPQQASLLFNSPLGALAAANLKLDYGAFGPLSANVINSPPSVGSSLGTAAASPLSSSLSPADVEFMSKLLNTSSHAAASFPPADSSEVLRVMRNLVQQQQQPSPLSSMLAASSSAAGSPMVQHSIDRVYKQEPAESTEAPRRIRRRRTKSPRSAIKRPASPEPPLHEQTASPGVSVASAEVVMRTTSESRDFGEGGEELSAEERQRQKTCRICGDQASGYNFNVVSCESCKAFFRRNANRTKDFKCPYTEECEITPVSRRFCQKCRLQKCFAVGMKKEWILNEDQLRRRKNSRLNGMKTAARSRSPKEAKGRANQQKAVESALKAVKTEMIEAPPSVPPPTFASALDLSSPTFRSLGESLGQPPFTPLRSIPEVQRASVSSTPVLSAEHALPPPISFGHPLPPASTPLAMISEEPMPLLQTIPVQPAVQSPQLERPPTLQPAVDFYAPTFNPPAAEAAPQLSASDEAAIKREMSIVPQTPEASGLNAGPPLTAGLISPSSGGSTPIFSFFSLSPATLHNFGRQIQTAYDDYSPMLEMTIPPPQLEEFASSSSLTSVPPATISNQQDAYAAAVLYERSTCEERSSLQLNSAELCSLDVVRQAYLVMDEPLEEDNGNSRGVECLAKDQKDPSDILNIMDLTMRRFVKMTKRLAAFVRLSQDGKLALLKAAMIQMLTVRGVTRFDTKRFCWSAPGNSSTVSCDMFDQLNDKRSQSKTRFLRFCERIAEEIKANPMVINLIGLVILFQHTNALLCDRDRELARESHNLYSNLLRRYLESTIHPYARAREVIGSIPGMLEELGVISNTAEQLFVGRVRPTEVEQLPQEFFVTKLDGAAGSSANKND
ncbi:hypothetical protein M3Y99_00070200 [Aphelenchoides fujianensis]|nr:hypothetical protein M3Y99_00070200 [Aphelenchoides fujianensis]